MSFADYAASLQMRDLIQKMVQTEVARLRPKYRYAQVKSINRANYSCTVVYVGEPSTNEVPVKMGSVQPMAVGQTVRIEGIGVDRFITDVMGESYTDSRIDAMGTWTPYTPTFEGKTTNPTGWNVSGFFSQIGKSVDYEITATATSGFTIGSGVYSFGLPLPLPAQTLYAVGQAMATGSARTYFALCTNQAPAGSYDASKIQLVVPGSSPAQYLNDTGPYGTAWVQGSIVRILGRYRSA